MAARKTSKPPATLNTSFYKRRRADELKDPEVLAEYELARAEIAQVDAIMQQLDDLREQAGCSKAELARRIGKNPAAVRRLFSAEVNPELKTIAALATALGAEVKVVRTSRARTRRRATA
jgi:ribosome-binding protein aMBF1 (putative translation factor)